MRLIDADKLESVDFSECMDSFEIMCIIDAQPTVNTWIPCSERLPEEEGTYLVTLEKWNTVTFAEFRNANHNPHFNARVIAWQPLPQPYNATEN